MGIQKSIEISETDAALESIRHWHGLAEAELDMAEHEQKVFGPEHSVQVKYNKAEQFRGVAATTMLEELTGEEWCACQHQLRPARTCPRNLRKGPGF
jgi:hypothetical protein